MAIATSGIYRLTLKGTYVGQECLNVFHYREESGLNTEAAQLALDFNTVIFPGIKAIQNTAYEYDEISVVPLFGDGIDAVRSLSGLTGDIAGANVAPPYVLPVKLNRDSRATRNGSKRFSGMIEENMTEDGWTSAFITLATTSLTLLDDAIGQVGFQFFPVILRRPDSFVFSQLTYTGVDSITVQDRNSTQGTRKTYR